MSDDKNLKIELYHDSLAKRIFEKASRREKLRLQLERMVKDRYNIAQTQENVFLSKEELALISTYVDESALEPAESGFVVESRERIERKQKEEVEQLKQQNELLEKKRILQRRLNWFLVLFSIALLVSGALTGWSYFYGKAVYADSLFNLADLRSREDNYKAAIGHLSEALAVSKLFFWSSRGHGMKLDAFEGRFEAYDLWQETSLDSLNFELSTVTRNPAFRQYVYFAENKVQNLSELLELADDRDKSYFYLLRGDIMADLYFDLRSPYRIRELIRELGANHPDFPLQEDRVLYAINDFAVEARKDYLAALELAGFQESFESGEYGDYGSDELELDSVSIGITREVCLDVLAGFLLQKGDTLSFHNFLDSLTAGGAPTEFLFNDLIWTANYFVKGEFYEKAVEKVMKLIELVPEEDQPEYYGFLADIYESMEEYTKAMEALERARQITGENAAEKAYYDKKIQRVSDILIESSTASGEIQVTPEFMEGNQTFVTVIGSNASLDLNKASKGYYTSGDYSIRQLLEEHSGLIYDTLGLARSAVAVIESIVFAEGNANTVFTNGSHYLSYGIFYWSLGFKTKKGELPALLLRYKRLFPDKFQTYFQDAGLDVSSDTDLDLGYFVLNGKKINSAILKEQFRSPEWAFRFWLAGKSPEMFVTQIIHALGRLDKFYFGGRKIAGDNLSKIITSEYGVSLLLDNHLNRPGYVRDCLRDAMTETALGDPQRWDTDDEMQVLDTYVKIRAGYGKFPMEDATRRAKITRGYVEQGRLSGDRGSFDYIPK